MSSPEAMSATHETFSPSLGSGLALWRRQVAAILAIELRKSVRGRRAIPVYLLALLPAAAMLIVVGGSILLRDEGILTNVGMARRFYAGVYQLLVLRAVIFFGCAGIFTNLMRGEVLDRSLHYYFLSPVRREVLVIGKFLAGLTTTFLLFGGATVVSYSLLYVPFGRIGEQLLSGEGLHHLFAYLGTTLLACIGYGALFMLVGLLFRNPILSVITLYLWEWIHVWLPAALKKLSVLHYVKVLAPVPVSEGAFAVVAEPPPEWMSVGGLLFFATAVLIVASLLIRRFEIRYSDD